MVTIFSTAMEDLSPKQGGTMYPSVVGHEIVGIVRRIGSDVKDIKAGDLVGVGPNVWRCGKCSACERDLEQYCVSINTI